MKVKILCEFDVTSADVCDDNFDERTAKAAASLAAHNFLSLVEISGYSSDTESVTIHVDGFGECEVSLGDDHD